MAMFSSDEQMKSSLKQLAEMAKYYHDQLTKQGFSEGHAFLLTREWQRSIMSGALEK
jgi:hypothetical protein